ncbi:hypothetical protein WH96_05485 [Kiloniella spongiae]|uniref:Uncharacterized protein n=1 Tax=Kiloniella spongiae TaxID=1489064 RepID=A0A0H2MLY2_9PROT|nr:hypothetical protein [Kiloniella spongiae]KLN61752.1 hypothetical protein WH96_05485 [Kiloniella spongiae]
MNIKEYRDPHPNPWLGDGILNGVLNGVTELLSTATYSPENLIIATEEKLKVMRKIMDKDKTLWGRLQNKFNGEKPDRILVDGGMLVQLFELSKQKSPYTITPSHQYTIPYSDLYELYRKLLLVLAPEKAIRLGIKG